MEEVINRPNSTAEIEDIFSKSLSRYFSFSCKEDRRGNLICDASVRNLRRPSQPIVSKVSLPKAQLDNHGYVAALVEKSLRDLIYPLGN